MFALLVAFLPSSHCSLYIFLEPPQKNFSYHYNMSFVSFHSMTKKLFAIKSHNGFIPNVRVQALHREDCTVWQLRPAGLRIGYDFISN